MTSPDAEADAVAGAPLPWRAASWLATAVALAAFGLVVVHWGWRWFGPAEQAAPGAAPPERLASVITATPLFGRAAGLAASNVGAGAQTAATLQGDTRLLGVLAQRDGGGFALFRLPDRGAVLVKTGDEIANDVTLASVHADGVRIRDHGVERELRLRPVPVAAVSVAPPARAIVAGGAVRAACVAPTGFKGPVYRLNAELLTGIAAQPEGWAALLTPADGGLAVRDQSGFASMLGMKAGDRLVQANGIALAGADDVLVALVKPLVANQPVHVVGRRDGKSAEWLFVNAGACP